MKIPDIRRARLKEWFSKHSIPPQEKSYISQLLHGKAPFGEKAARRLEVEYGMGNGYLDRIGPTHENDLHGTGISPGPAVRREAPLISWVMAGQFVEATDTYHPGDGEKTYPVPRAAGPRTFCLRVEGDSMTSPFGRSYPAGCIIFVDPDVAPDNGRRVIARLKGSDEVTFKMLVREAGKTFLRPLNPQYPAIHDPFVVLGTVIGKWEDE